MGITKGGGSVKTWLLILATSWSTKKGGTKRTTANTSTQQPGTCSRVGDEADGPVEQHVLLPRVLALEDPT